MNSYLGNRSQSVIVNGFKSFILLISTGVPQGFHLGPFCTIHIFDLTSCFKNIKHLMYADNKKIYLKVNNFNVGNILQQELNSVYKYYSGNRINKTNMLLLQL